MSDKEVEKVKNIHFIFNNFFSFEILPVDKIRWKRMVQPDRSQIKI